MSLWPAIAPAGMTVEALSPRHRQRTTKAYGSFTGSSEVPKYDCSAGPQRACKFSVSAHFPPIAGRESTCGRRTRELVDPYRASVDELPLREYYPQERTRRRISRPPAAPAGAAGERVLGRYLLAEQLGAGGFGVVWRAHDELLDREVAVKRINLGDEDDGERASREAMACARLSHPSIVALYEASAVEDAFFLISELVDGETLAQHIADGALMTSRSSRSGCRWRSALEHAHERGVIHRDIKPQNVLVPAHPREAGAAAKLADFGGASLVGEDALTRTGDVLGTLAYMAPEQVEGGEVGEEADLYSLALVLYEALSGVNPVRGPTPAATARRIGRRLAPLARVRRDLPPDLTLAVDTALAPSPGDRGTVEDLREAIGRAAGRAARTRRLRPRAHRVRSERATRGPRSGRAPAARVDRGPARPEASPQTQQESTHAGCRSRARLGSPAGRRRSAGRRPAGAPVSRCSCSRHSPPVLLLPRERGSTGVGAGWLGCALAPALGLAGLAAAFPAVAGQARSWRERGARARWDTGGCPCGGARGAHAVAGPGGAGHARRGSPPRRRCVACARPGPHGRGPARGGSLGGRRDSAAVARPRPKRDPDLAAPRSGRRRSRSPACDWMAASRPSAAHRATGLILGSVLGGMFAVAARALRGPV